MRRLLLIGLWADRGDYPHVPPLVRECGLELVVEERDDVRVDVWTKDPPAGIILSGSRYDLGKDCQLSDFAGALALLDRLPSVPVLGICFGHQLLAYAYGGTLGRMGHYRDDPDWAITMERPHRLFAGLPPRPTFAENHGMRVETPGVDYDVVATSEDGIEVVAHRTLPRVGVQFHPEYYPKQRVPNGRSFLTAWMHSLTAARSHASA
jgi:GMP synthase-like glutamine amidotransferase